MEVTRVKCFGELFCLFRLVLMITPYVPPRVRPERGRRLHIHSHLTKFVESGTPLCCNLLATPRSSPFVRPSSFYFVA